MGTNLIPYTGLNYLTAFTCGINCKQEGGNRMSSAWPITKQLFSANATSCSMYITEGQYMCASVIFRGENVSPRETHVAIEKISQESSHVKFAEWCPFPIKFSQLNGPNYSNNLSI